MMSRRPEEPRPSSGGLDQALAAAGQHGGKPAAAQFPGVLCDAGDKFEQRLGEFLDRLALRPKQRNAPDRRACRILLCEQGNQACLYQRRFAAAGAADDRDKAAGFELLAQAAGLRVAAEEVFLIAFLERPQSGKGLAG